ncbi:alpha/beta hydrolase-fold protein [Radiobacillus sp. PE A8.2]|uniref:alpha/beta hydrolase-fold protein n=1 Tax=Radiobacillus sp. PE A8.2 TaxID=3380349 RepID=UPI00388E4961
MKNSRRIFAVMMIILLVSTSINLNVFAAGTTETVTGGDVSVSYDVTLPQGYDENGRSYPVLYVMPEDGVSSYSDQMLTMIQEKISTDHAGDMIVVAPKFVEGEDFRVTMDQIITHVDENYNTIPTVNQRAILGAGIGGYMAYIMGMTDTEGDTDAVLSAPNQIKNIGSIRGNFTGSDHPLTEEYDDVYDIISEIGKEDILNYYTYLDGPTEDSYTYMTNSTNDIGSLFIDWYKTLSYDYHEYTARFGSYDDAFLEESINRVINRFSQQFYSDMVDGNVSITPQVAASAVENIEVEYTINVSDFYSTTSSKTADMTVKVELTDPEDGSVLHSDAKTLSVAGPDRFEGTFTIPNTVNGASSNVTVTAEVLGYKVEIGNQSLIRIMDTGTEADEQLIDLMGDWKFNAYKPYSNTDRVALDDINNLTKDKWSTWGTVQPALGWWSADFDETLGGNSNWIGYAWYVREFDMPADFQTEDLILALGKFDEADEVYVNGVRIGSTGIPEAGGAYDGSNPWDVDRLYDLDASVLNYGGTNTIAVRMANSNGGGGWYEGPVGIYSPAAYNKIVGLPSELAEASVTQQITDFVATQHAALEASDIQAYAKTVAADYFQAGYDKNRLVEKVSTYVSGEGNVSVTDSSVNVYNYNGMYLYQADRTITTASGETVTEQVNDYYIMEDGNVILYGDHDRFYVDTYPSAYGASAQGIDGIADMTHRVYLPDGYFNSDKRYPVVYLLHQFSSTSKFYEIDGIDALLDKGIANGDIKDMIVVIPDSSAISWWRGDWELMVTEDLVPFVNNNYRTISDARFNGVAGASMGGQGAYGVGLENPNLFSSITSFFGAFSYGGAHSPNLIAEQVSDEYLNYYTHYFISGNRDVYGFGSPNIKLDKQLRASGVDHMFMIENGEHTSAFYIPHVIEAFSYVSDNMFSTGGEIANNATGALEAAVSDAVLDISATLQLDSEFSKWLNVVPDSDFTKNTNPEMTIPVTLEIVQDGKSVFKQVEYPVVSGSTSLEFDKQIVLGGSLSDAYSVDPEKDFTLRVYASLLDTNKQIGTFAYTAPDEEEEDPTTDPVVDKPDVEQPTKAVVKKNADYDKKTKKATISDDSLDKLANGGTLEVSLKAAKGADEVTLELTAAQVQKLKDKNASIVLSKDDLNIKIPAVNFTGEGSVQILIQKYQDDEAYLSSVYNLTIKQSGSIIDTFDAPVTLTFKVNKNAKKAEKVNVYYYNEETEKWELIGGEFDGKYVTADTNHFSIFTVLKSDEQELVTEKPIVEDKEEDQQPEESKDDEKGKEQLPDTASNQFNWLLAGLALSVIGFLLYRKNKHLIK